jgi:hypothetical protein
MDLAGRRDGLDLADAQIVSVEFVTHCIVVGFIG